MGLKSYLLGGGVYGDELESAVTSGEVSSAVSCWVNFDT
jgi:hypothetical protein